MIPVVADADTLFGATTRGLLIHLDYQGLIRLHWSPLILDEMSRALVDTGGKPDAASARRHEQLMQAALPQAEVPTTRVQAQFASVAPATRSTKDVERTLHLALLVHDLGKGYVEDHSEVGARIGEDLCAALFCRLTAQPPPAVRPSEQLVAHFPAELRRDPASAYLTTAYHDVPWEDPELCRRLLRSVR